MIETGFVVGIILMVFWTPYLMAKGIKSLTGDVGFGDKIKCSIPIFNILNAEREYFGGIKFCSISTILFILMSISKFLTWFFVNGNGPLNLITSILWIVSLLLMYVANCIFVYTVIHDAEGLGPVKLLLASIMYPIGQYYIGVLLVKVINNARKVESTFNV